MDDSFEYVRPNGDLLTKQAFIDWFSTKGYGSTAAPIAPADAAAPSGGDAGGSSSTSGRSCMWLDQYSERQLAPGVWLARYMELHQPFAGARLSLFFLADDIPLLLLVVLG